MRGWGIDYFKTDFCYAGAYEGLRHEAMEGVPAYRRGLGLIRDAIGADALLVGCGAPSLASAGLVDAMRVGPDIAANYEPSQPHPSLPSQRNAARNVTARAWQHGRFWNNDPDCLMLRPGVERREDWAAVCEATEACAPAVTGSTSSTHGAWKQRVSCLCRHPPGSCPDGTAPVAQEDARSRDPS